MQAFIELTYEYQKALIETSRATEKLKAVLVAIVKGRDILKKEFSEENLCSVCMERKKVRALNCGHCFCSTCTSRILALSQGDPPTSRCPVCRSAVHRSIRVYIDA